MTYMVSSIQYGGRITDGFDELLMDTYAGKYFNQGALEKDKTLFPGYDVPDGKTVGTSAAHRAFAEPGLARDFRAAQQRGPDVPHAAGEEPRRDGGEHHAQVRRRRRRVVPLEIVDKIAEDLLSKVGDARSRAHQG